jgi:hypothetical protein
MCVVATGYTSTVHVPPSPRNVELCVCGCTDGMSVCPTADHVTMTLTTVRRVQRSTRLLRRFEGTFGKCATARPATLQLPSAPSAVRLSSRCQSLSCSVQALFCCKRNRNFTWCCVCVCVCVCGCVGVKLGSSWLLLRVLGN